jgi:hypothetical protein
LQRRHSRVNVIGIAPDHWPVVEVRVLPVSAVPLITGGSVFVGPSGIVTIEDGSDVADSVPTPLVAVTCTRKVEATSAADST